MMEKVGRVTTSEDFLLSLVKELRAGSKGSNPGFPNFVVTIEPGSSSRDTEALARAYSGERVEPIEITLESRWCDGQSSVKFSGGSLTGLRAFECDRTDFNKWLAETTDTIRLGKTIEYWMVSAGIERQL